jgi:polyisoprenyl-phosphate glycosyltransferase
MRIAIVTPVFNDWNSLSELVRELERVDVPPNIEFHLFAVDDGSSEAATFDSSGTHQRIREIEIIGLACNLGHQRAIAVGLVEVSNHKEFDAVLVMDSDGEDRPADIPRLLELASQRPGHIICVWRRRRPGHVVFRFWYECYRLTFHLLTGARINFGNFCLIPIAKVEALVRNSSIWNNLAATVERSRIPLAGFPSDRGKRYAGESKMNFVTLVMHGLSAIAVYSDVVMVRLMLAATVLSGITLIGIVVVVLVKSFSNLAIPGWASSVAGLLTVVLLQAVVLFTISAFSILNARNMKVISPQTDAPTFVLFRQKILSPSVVR